MKVLILVPGPQNTLPSQRFRVEQYLRNTDNNDSIQFTLSSFYTLWAWNVLYKKGHAAKKIMGVLYGFIKRFFLLFTLFEYEFIYIHREAASVGPPVLEWLIAKVWRKKIIYDFDDAIWVNASSESNPLASYVKCAWKVKYICKWSYAITVGNDYLARFASQYNDDVRIIPTIVDTVSRHQYLKPVHDGIQTIGWTGTFTNFPNFDLIADAIKALQAKHSFRLLIIADKDPGFTKFDYEFKKWQESSEIDDLLQIDIGLMPLQNRNIELGKCAFKAIQYMSLGIPSVVSPVGANCNVVPDRLAGLWANNTEEWYSSLDTLLTNKEMRQKMGIASRKRVIDHYSVLATMGLFLNLFTVAQPTNVFRPISITSIFSLKNLFNRRVLTPQ